jgi:IstB-like ATP binding protein
VCPWFESRRAHEETAARRRAANQTAANAPSSDSSPPQSPADSENSRSTTTSPGSSPPTPAATQYQASHSQQGLNAYGFCYQGPGRKGGCAYHALTRTVDCLEKATRERGRVELTEPPGWRDDGDLLHFEQWGEILGDAMVATALIDRLVHHATMITLKGKSYRLRERALDVAPAAQAPSSATPPERRRPLQAFSRPQSHTQCRSPRHRSHSSAADGLPALDPTPNTGLGWVHFSAAQTGALFGCA